MADDARITALAVLEAAAQDWRFEGDVEPADAPDGARGLYEGLPPHVALLPDGRKAQLLKPLAFVGADARRWPVPKDVIVDGASIPRVAWSAVGGPFDGPYRDASIIHDHYCHTKERTWQDTHRVFHEAMRVSGVGAVKAKIMFYAVWNFGPRWSGDETDIAAAFDEPLAEPTAIEIIEFAGDAEAIFRHDLSREEVERLADARRAARTRIKPAFRLDAKTVSAVDEVRRLVIVGGSGRAEDLEATVAAAVQLPPQVITRFLAKGVRIVACRGSVTDFETDLKGVVPRGWERTGRTWDQVPGAFFPDRNRVVVATVEAAGRRVIPGRDSGLHGSASLLIHESLHGFDYIGRHAVLRDAGFLAARTADLPRLGAYERQSGQAGLEETYAESGARFLAEPVAMQQDWAALFGFWASALANVAVADVPTGPEIALAFDETAPIGVAAWDGDAIVLDLRAEGPGGALGHAMFRIEPDDPAHAAVGNHVFSGAKISNAREVGPALVWP